MLEVMRSSLWVLVLGILACGHRSVPTHADAAADALADTAGDAAGSCQYEGAPGACVTMAACGALADHSAFPVECAAPLACCIVTPSVADNPPTPAGYKLMMQSEVTSAMTSWAIAILNDPVTYPMFATATMMFGNVMVLARVEWHPPDFQNSAVHRGVTLYERV
jgi:hypothetical protein